MHFPFCRLVSFRVVYLFLLVFIVSSRILNSNFLLCHLRVHNEFIVCENITIWRFLEIDTLLICILMQWSILYPIKLNRHFLYGIDWNCGKTIVSAFFRHRSNSQMILHKITLVHFARGLKCVVYSICIYSKYQHFDLLTTACHWDCKHISVIKEPFTKTNFICDEDANSATYYHFQNLNHFCKQSAA